MANKEIKISPIVGNPLSKLILKIKDRYIKNKHLDDGSISMRTLGTDVLNTLEAETTRATNAEQELSRAIGTETTNRINADQAMQGNINSEINRAQGVEQQLSTAISNEILRAKGAESTLQGNIDAEETRAKDAEKNNADDIDAIEEKIPFQASSSNQLADKNFVNSSIATASATFRGTYNLVTDLSLSVSATHAQIQTALTTKMSALSIVADNNDYAFVQIPTTDATPTEIAKIEKYKYNGSAWAYEYELNNSGFTATQWAAINSGATLELIGKLSALPTNAELTTLLAGKVDKVNGKGLSTNDYTNEEKAKLGALPTNDALNIALGAKQDVINDLADIRSGASAGATAVQPATLSTALSNTVAESGVFDLSAYNNGTTYADLNAALTALNTLTDIYKKGGMSIKFVRTSDNKYVQYSYKGTATTGTPNPFLEPDNWIENGVEQIININHYKNKTEAYSNRAAARNDVPAFMRNAGIKLSYLLSDGWHTDMFIGSDIQDTNWTNNQNWISDGPIEFKAQSSMTNEVVIGNLLQQTLPNLSELYDFRTLSPTVLSNAGFSSSGLITSSSGNTVQYVSVSRGQAVIFEGLRTQGAGTYCGFFENIPAIGESATYLRLAGSVKEEKQLFEFVADSDGYIAVSLYTSAVHSIVFKVGESKMSTLDTKVSVLENNFSILNIFGEKQIDINNLTPILNYIPSGQNPSWVSYGGLFHLMIPVIGNKEYKIIPRPDKSFIYCFLKASGNTGPVQMASGYTERIIERNPVIVTAPYDAKYLYVYYSDAATGSQTPDSVSVLSYKHDSPSDGYENFIVEVDTTKDNYDGDSLNYSETNTSAYDRGIIMFPNNYNANGKPVRLFIVGYGTTGKITSSSTEAEFAMPLNGAILGEGYAILQVNATPGSLDGNDIGPLGGPNNHRSVLAAYKYVTEKYNIATDGVFIGGYSQGCLNMLQVACFGTIKVLAGVLYGPVLDIWKRTYVGTNPERRAMIMSNFGFTEKKANDYVMELYPTYTENDTVTYPSSFSSAGSIPNDEEIAYILNNIDNWACYNPMTCGLDGNHIVDIFRVWQTIDGTDTEYPIYKERSLQIPCPLKLFVSLDDTAIPFKYLKWYQRMAYNAGKFLKIRKYVSGGHNYRTATPTIQVESKYNGTISTNTASWEGLKFVERYDK